MKDGPIRAALKTRLAHAYVAASEQRRAQEAKRGQLHWQLVGACEGCGSCCEEPSIAVGALVYWLPLLSWPFLWWQRVVNGFEFKTRQREGHAFAFRCTHFDAVTRRCDAYDSRPGMCRDYPRLQLETVSPELFERCRFRIVAKNGEAMIAALKAQGVSDAQLVQITRKLKLE